MAMRLGVLEQEAADLRAKLYELNYGGSFDSTEVEAAKKA